MQYIQGDCLTAAEETDLLVTPCNAVVNKDKLVMGAGFAKRIKEFGEQYGIDVPLIAGKAINKQKMPSIYGLIIVDKLGFLQTKNHFSEESSLLLLNYGLKLLSDYCVKHPNKRVDMPFPCIGNGNLTIDDVKPLLDAHLLEHNVNIWHL